MKKFLITTVLAVAIAFTSFANPATGANYFVQSTFKAEFKGATDVKWSTCGSLTKASFVLDENKTEAFFDVDGKLVAVSKTVNLNDLPIKAKRSFAKKYDGYTVTNAIKFESADENAYYMYADNGQEQVMLKVNDCKTLSEVK